jgi:hypothetical protein
MFSDAINSICVCWRSISLIRESASAGSVSFTLAVQNEEEEVITKGLRKKGCERI